MKIFIKNGFVFVLPLIFIILIFEIYISVNKKKILSEEKLKKAYTNSIEKYSWINSSYEKSEIVLLSGSSTVKHGVNNELLNNLAEGKVNFINIGNLAGDPIESYFIINSIINNNIYAVYYGIDPWIFTRNYYKHRKKIMYLDLNFVQSLKFSLKKDKNIFIKRYLEVFSFYNFLNKINAKDKDLFTNEIDIDSIKTNLVVERKIIDPLKQFNISVYGWSDLQFKYLRKIHELCQKNNITFVPFYPPKMNSYSRIYFEECNVSDEFEDKFSKEVGNIRIEGKFNQFLEQFDSLYFVDEVHLNVDGRNRYSYVFFNEIYSHREK